MVAKTPKVFRAVVSVRFALLLTNLRDAEIAVERRKVVGALNIVLCAVLINLCQLWRSYAVERLDEEFSSATFYLYPMNTRVYCEVYE